MSQPSKTGGVCCKLTRDMKMYTEVSKKRWLERRHRDLLFWNDCQDVVVVGWSIANLFPAPVGKVGGKRVRATGGLLGSN